MKPVFNKMATLKVLSVVGNISKQITKLSMKKLTTVHNNNNNVNTAVSTMSQVFGLTTCQYVLVYDIG